MTRRSILALMVVVVAVVVVIFALDAHHDRKLVVNAFWEERLAATKELAAQLEARFATIRQDVLLLRSVIEESTLADVTTALVHSEAKKRFESILHALLRRVEHYKELRLVGPDGIAALKVRDHGWQPGADSEALDQALRNEGLRAPQLQSRVVRMLRVQRANTAPDAPAYRVFSTPVRFDRGRSGAVLLLVEPRFLFQPLHTFRAPDNPRFVLLNATGQHVAVNAPGLARELDRELVVAGGRSPLGERLFGEDAGRVELSEPIARRLGLGGFAVATFARLHRMNEWQWTLVAFSSAKHLVERDHAVVLRSMAAMGAVLAGLALLGMLLLRKVRREASLEERLRRADEIRELHELSQRIIDIVPVGLLALSSELEVRQANDAIRALNPSIARGMRVDAAFAGAQEAELSRVTEAIDRSLAGRSVERVLFDRAQLFAQGPGDYKVTAIPLSTPLEGVVMLLAIEDLTHLKQLERELVRAEKLSTMGILAAGIAHEIGTPLGVVRARAEMLAGKFGHDVAAMRSILAIIEQSDAISGIISRVLEFTRSRPMETKLVGVGPACREAVDLLRERFEAKQVSVDVDAPDELPLLVADPQGFRHVILNLLRNACDACAKGGEVHVVATLDPDADAPAVTLAVSDNGCGIAREHLHSIFDPFFTTKKGGEGTGLGLAIAQDIVKNHNGTIAVESTPGQGSRFAVRWPAKERTVREERGASPATSATSA